MHFAWNGPPTAGLEVGNYSVRLKADLVPQCSGRGLFSIHGVGRMRLLIDDAIVIDNWEEPVVAPILFGRGAGQLTAACELIEEKPLRITVEFQAPEENLSDRALELSPVPPTERENRAFGPAGVTVGYRPPMPEDLLECAEALARASDVVVIVVGTNEDWESEGFDRDSLRLPGDQDELIARITKANSHVVIVLNAGSAIEMPWIKDASSVLQLWLPGQEAGNALADVLFGDVDPSGRLPVSVPVRLQDSGGVVGYPGSDKKLHYVDGINVGYRHFDAAGIEPAFCFGHGLSYTTFSYGPLTIKALPEGGVRAMATVTNSGKRSGTEVAQLYVHDVAATNTRPPCELKGFTKMWLDPGEHAIASFDLPPTAFSFWDSSQHAFTVEAGTFELLVGASSRDIRSRLRFNLGKGGELLD
jgi:beta-glucosidase